MDLPVLYLIIYSQKKINSHWYLVNCPLINYCSHVHVMDLKINNKICFKRNNLALYGMKYTYNKGRDFQT